MPDANAAFASSDKPRTVPAAVYTIFLFFIAKKTVLSCYVL
jgi:hypothetical protein